MGMTNKKKIEYKFLFKKLSELSLPYSSTFNKFITYAKHIKRGSETVSVVVFFSVVSCFESIFPTSAVKVTTSPACL